jgi:hypothetical protein
MNHEIRGQRPNLGSQVGRVDIEQHSRTRCRLSVAPMAARGNDLDVGLE